MKRKIIKKRLYNTSIITILLAIALLISGMDKRENYLNFIAQFYFDKEYYLENYPEVKDSELSAFEHYKTIGWKESKNPTAEFNNDFYIGAYLATDNKYNLNPLADYIRYKINFKKRLTNEKQIKKVTPLKNPKYYLTLVAIFQNEARFLKEWIEFYRMIGVEHFYLYNHLSTDDYMQVLEPYIKAGIVELEQVTEEPRNLSSWNDIQTSTYENAAKKVAEETEWLIIVDTDEFLFPVKEKNLANALKDYDEHPALSVNWQIFGSSSVEKIADNKLMTETLLKKSNAKDLHVKTIIKPRYIQSIQHPHFSHMLDGYMQVDENKKYLFGPFLPKESRNIFRINHYWSRDLAFLHKNKIGRMHVTNKDGKGNTTKEKKEKIKKILLNDKNSSISIDRSILKYKDELRKRVFNKKI